MFDWLFEGHLSVYFLLTAMAALFIVLGVRTRKRRWYAVAAGAVAVAGLYCVLDFAVETDREQIQRKVRAMAADLTAPAHLDAVMENVSDRFHCPFADSKKALREKREKQSKRTTSRKFAYGTYIAKKSPANATRPSPSSRRKSLARSVQWKRRPLSARRRLTTSRLTAGACLN